MSHFPTELETWAFIYKLTLAIFVSNKLYKGALFQMFIIMKSIFAMLCAYILFKELPFKQFTILIIYTVLTVFDCVIC